MGESDIDPGLLETWRSARIWLDLPVHGGTEIIPGDHTEATVFPDGTDAVHLLTAWNPGGRELDRRVNESRNAELLATLDRDELEHWPAAGYSADRSWLERGFALPRAGRRLAVEIAARAGQLAIYEWCAHGLAIVECSGGGVTATYGWTSRPLAVIPAGSL